MSVCVCVSLSAIASSTAHPIFIKCFVHVTDGRGSVVLWRRSDTLCTSGFMDDAIFALISQVCSTSPPSTGAGDCVTESIYQLLKLKSLSPNHVSAWSRSLRTDVNINNDL